MIGTFRDGWLREFYLEDERSRRVPAELENVLFRKLQMIDDADQEKDLRVPTGNRLEKLQGDLEGYWSIRVNQRYRLIFQWHAGRSEALDMYLDDHSYK